MKKVYENRMNIEFVKTLFDEKIISGTVIVTLIVFFLMMLISFQENEYVKIFGKLRKLQSSKASLENVKLKLLKTKSELENTNRIKAIAKNQFGLIEQPEKKVIVIREK
jgi:cell division protein FtsL